jgi:methylamine utilization protein MauE
VPYVEVACRLLLATVFAIALAGKVSSATAWTAFEDSLREMDVVPENRVAVAARGSVATEFAIVVCLLIPSMATGLAGFVLAGGLLAAFTWAIMIVVRRKQKVACRCFGASTTPLSLRHMIRNELLIAVALTGFITTANSGTAALPAAILAGVTGAVIGMLVAALDDIVALLRPL